VPRYKKFESISLQRRVARSPKRFAIYYQAEGPEVRTHSPPAVSLRTVKVDYMMRRNGESWLISDIYLDGAISEVATRRSEFSTILRNEGIDSLIAALNRKADILTGTTAKAL